VVWLVGLSLLGLCWLIKQLSSLTIEVIPFLTVSALIAVLYLSAYWNLLQPVTYFLLILGGVSLLSLSATWVKKRAVVNQTFFTPNFMSFLFYVLVFGVLAQGIQIAGFDEFTQWGPHAKLLFLHHGFVTQRDIVVHKDYPPGGALFYSLFYALGGYREGASYFGQVILMLSAMLAILPTQPQGNWRKSFIMISVTIATAIVLKTQIGIFGSLYMDSLVGLFIGAILTLYFRYAQKVSILLYICLPVIAFTLFKLKLFVFSLVIFGVVVCDSLISFYYEKNKKPFPWAKLIFALLIPAACYITNLSWLAYLKGIQVPLEWGMPGFSIAHFLHALTSPTALQQTIIHSFFHKLLSYVPLLCVFIVLIVIATALTKDKHLRTRYTACHGILALSLMGYYVGLLIMYLYSFTPYEASYSASMTRYADIFHLVWAIVILFQCMQTPWFKEVRMPKMEMAFTALIISGLGGIIFLKHLKWSRPQHIHESVVFAKHNVEKIAAATQKYVADDKRVFVIWENSNGFEKGMLEYALTPIRLNLGSSSIGKPYEKQDVWTKNITVKKLANEISHYDYLLLAYTDAPFWKQYQPLFQTQHEKLKPITTYQLCRINGFNGDIKVGCHVKNYHAYLFKIKRHGKKISLVNVVNNHALVNEVSHAS